MTAFHRVVGMSLPLSADALRLFAEGSAAKSSTYGGKPVELSVEFEPKVGGGGHLLFRRSRADGDPSRLIIEPVLDGATAVAWVTDADYRLSDDHCRTEVSRWLKDVFGWQAPPLPKRRGTP